MRTTTTLDDDVVAIIRRRMSAEGIGFKAALNATIRDGAPGRPKPAPFKTETLDLGEPLIDLTHLNSILDEWDVDDFLELDLRLRRTAE